MGMFDGIINFFKGSKEETPRENNFEKEQLARQVEELVRKISELNSFNIEIRNLTNKSYRDLQSMKSLEELKRLKFQLEKTLVEEKAKRENSKGEDKSPIWTGEKPKGMTDERFRAWQDAER